MKVALVTGSSGGVGQQIVSRLLGDGYTVIGIDRKAPHPQTLHTRYSHVEFDIANLDELGMRVRSIKESIGLFIHAAAVQPLISAATGTISEWENAFHVNVLSAEVIASEIKDSLSLNEPHAIFVFGSVHDRQSSKSIAPYSVSKAALAGWARAAAIDLAPQVSVINIAIGATRTSMLLSGLARNGDPEGALNRLEHSLLSESVLEPEDVAQFCIQLLDSPLIHLSGATIRLDSGSSIVLGTEIH